MFSRSSISEMIPCAADWKSVIPSTPVKMKPMKLKPAARPRLLCRVPPISPTKMNGKTRVKTSRVRSRKSLVTSREATVRIAFSSFIRAPRPRS